MNSFLFRGPTDGFDPSDSFVPGGLGSKLVVGIARPHPEPTDGSILVPGVSVADNPSGGNDKKVASDLNVTVYAIDKKYIHKIDPAGNVSNKNKRDMEILKDALESRAGVKR